MLLPTPRAELNNPAMRTSQQEVYHTAGQTQEPESSEMRSSERNNRADKREAPQADAVKCQGCC